MQGRYCSDGHGRSQPGWRGVLCTCHQRISSKTGGGVWKVYIVPPAPQPGLRALLTQVTPSPWICQYTLPSKARPGGLQAELEKGADVIHGETGSVWKRWVIHQTVMGNLDGSGGWQRVKRDTTSKDTNTSESGTFWVVMN